MNEAETDVLAYMDFPAAHRTKRKRYGDDRAGCELTIGADVDPAAKRPGR